MEPTLAQVIVVVHESSGIHRKSIDSNTLIEADLHICGIGGEDLLEDCEEAFGVQLATEEVGYMKTFSLAENGSLFTGEGLDFFGICRFMRGVCGIPEPVIRDLTVGHLHDVLVNAVKQQVKRG